MALGFMAAFIAMAENSDSLKLWLNAMLEVGATTVPSHFLAFMAFLAAFMAFIVVVAFFSAASELRLSLLSSPSCLWVSLPPSSPLQRI